MASSPVHFLGSVVECYKSARIDIDVASQSFAANDVAQSNNLLPIEIPCATLTNGGWMHLYQLTFKELNVGVGTFLKADWRLHFVRNPYAVPAQNAAFKGPAEPNDYAGFVDILAAHWTADGVEIGDGAGTDPDYAVVTRRFDRPLTFKADALRTSLYLVAELLEVAAYGASHAVRIELDWHRA
jgi:hypothetical protein